jgi:FixJ family two-component response regulator
VSASELPVDSNPLVGIVDNQLSIRQSLGHLFRSGGLSVETFASGEEFLASAHFDSFSCLVLEVQLLGLTGFQLQRTLLISQIDIPIIFLTGHGDVSSAVRALKSGAVEFLTKPFDDQHLLQTVRSAIAHYADKRQVRQQNSQPNFGKFGRNGRSVAASEELNRNHCGFETNRSSEGAHRIRRNHRSKPRLAPSR